MNTHKNARLTPKGRADLVSLVVDKGLPPAMAARRFMTTPRTVAKWVGRFLEEGIDGLRDRSSRPVLSPSQIAPAICDQVERLRRDRIRWTRLRLMPVCRGQPSAGSASVAG